MASAGVSAGRRSRAVQAVVFIGLFLFASVGGATDEEPPRFEVAAPGDGAALTFVTYGDTRFTERPEVANALARRALVQRMAAEHPLAILIGGDLVYEGSNPEDYAVYRAETREWSEQDLRVFPALGNHEFKGCDADITPCLENWWAAFGTLSLKPFRWYSVNIGQSLLVLLLDSDSALKPGSPQRVWFEREIASADARTKFIMVLMHYPPVRDPIYPAGRDEKEIARYFAKNARSLPQQVVVVGSHVHNYERYKKNGVTYLVSGGGGAKPIPALRLFGELSHLRTSVNFHYLRFRLEQDRLSGTMVRFDADEHRADPWTEPDRFEVKAKR
jgi:acid phosphatase type 7